MLHPQKKIPYYYLSFVLIVLLVWFTYMQQWQLFGIIQDNFYAVITMIFGAFVAGSSPEGSAAIAYPIFTLLLDIEPSTTRNFAFAIQSIGMTSASILILNLKIKVEWNYIKYVSFAGLFGLLAGTYYVVPYISPKLAKLFFVSLWFSFGIVLWKINSRKDREVIEDLGKLKNNDVFLLLSFGFIGGVISSIFGTGINIFTYCFMVIFYKVSEKIATPSSVIIMTIETIAGFLIHDQFIGDFNQKSKELWLSCIPFVVFMAPLGAYVISKLNRIIIARILYAILIVQFFGALIVIKPDLKYAMFSLATILCGLTLFYKLSRVRR